MKFYCGILCTDPMSQLVLYFDCSHSTLSGRFYYCALRLQSVRELNQRYIIVCFLPYKNTFEVARDVLTCFLSTSSALIKLFSVLLWDFFVWSLSAACRNKHGIITKIYLDISTFLRISPFPVLSVFPVSDRHSSAIDKSAAGGPQWWGLLSCVGKLGSGRSCWPLAGTTDLTSGRPLASPPQNR